MKRVEAARAELGGADAEGAEATLADAVVALEPRVGELSARDAYALYRAAGALAGAAARDDGTLELYELAAKAVADVPSLARSAGRAEHELAAALYERGRRDEALVRLADARARLVEPPEVWADLTLLRAQYLRAARRWRGALAELAEVRGLLEDPDGEPAGDEALAAYRRDMSATALAEAGEIYREWGLFDLAERRLAELREELRELPESSPARIPAELFEANLLVARARTEELERFIHTTVREPRNAGRPGPRGRLLARLGTGLSEAARTDPALAGRAEDALTEALAAEGLPADERGKARLVLADLFLGRGLLARAEEELARAVGGLEVADTAYRAALAVALALERSDARERLAVLHADLVEAFAGFLADWRDVPLRPGGFGFLQYRGPRRVLSELIRAELALHGEEEGARRALAHVLEAQSLSSLARSLGGAGGSLEELRARLIGERHAFWILLPAPTRTHLFLVDGDRCRHVELAPRDVFEELCAELARRLAETPDRAGREAHVARVEEAARALAELFLAPPLVAGLARWRRVTVVGADLFGGLPVEVLPDPRGRTLGETVAITHLSSVADGLALDARNEPATARGAEEVWLVLASEVGGAAGLADLAAGDAEARRLVGRHAGARTFVGAAARAGVLEDPALARAAVLHAFAHGAADFDSERPPSLVLYGEEGGELFTCADVDALDPPPLVVLSACACGRGPERRGDGGAADLGGAFLGAGARAVVLSPYRLELHATLELMEAFHRELDRGRPPDEAMRRARRELAGSSRAWTFAHATVQVVGLGHEPVLAARAPGFPRWAGPAAAACALAAFAALVALRRRAG